MNSRFIFISLWLSFIAYAFFIAPPSQPDTWELIANLSTGHFQNINPLIVALFNLMGIISAIYACFLIADGKGQSIPTGIFLLGSFGLGAFALLPYFALRKKNSRWNSKKNWLINISESQILRIILTITALSLIFFGINNGDWTDFSEQWHNSKFIHVMSLDFCLLCLLFPVAIKDDLLRRNINNPSILAAISFVPLIGSLTYLCLRPRLQDQ